MQYKSYNFEIEGRADGIYRFEDKAIIDEIKSTTLDLESIGRDFNPLHWAQAKIYGYIYCIQNDLETIDIQITYFHIESEETKRFKEEWSIEDLYDFLQDIISQYVNWAELSFGWEEIRDRSIKNLEFPFSHLSWKYRKGKYH